MNHLIEKCAVLVGVSVYVAIAAPVLAPIAGPVVRPTGTLAYGPFIAPYLSQPLRPLIPASRFSPYPVYASAGPNFQIPEHFVQPRTKSPVTTLQAAAASRALKVTPALVESPVYYPPQPYSFGYESTDEFGTKQTRHETSDANNSKTGSYGFTDARGIYRQVNYVADAEGFRASISTNEPGTAPSAPAAAVYSAANVNKAATGILEKSATFAAPSLPAAVAPVKIL